MANAHSVVVPVYNSEQTLKLLVAELLRVLPTISSDYELILVNDGSRDRSWETVCELASTYSWITGINLMRNYGQHNALLCGIRAAKYPIIITLDDDLQHPPAEIPKLLQKLDEGYDVVYGTPEKAQHGLWRSMASQLIKLLLQNAMQATTARSVGPFRVFRTQVREAFANYHNPFVSIDVLLTWGTTRFAAIPVRHAPRRAGSSNYTVAKLLVHTLNMVTSFSTLPLQLVGLIGFAFTCLGMFLLAFILLRYLTVGQVVPGFAFLATVLVTFAGAQLFALGIIGEYLARIHVRMMERPAYTVREIHRVPVQEREPEEQTPT